MKKHITGILVATVIGMMMTGCISIGSSEKDYGKQMSKTITLNSDFTSIESSGITDIEYVQGPTSITLTAPEKIIENIKIEIRSGVLYVKDVKNLELNGFSNIKKAKLTVSAPSVGTFITSGIGDIDIKRLNVKEISLITNGTGDINLQTARCTKLNAESSGTGDIEISHLTCVVAECNTSGTGDITLDRLVAERISGYTSGMGDIKVSGECKEENLRSSGMGDINSRGLEIIKTEED